MDGNFEDRSIPELLALATWLENQIKKAEAHEDRNPQPRFSTRHGKLVTAPTMELLQLRREQLDAVRAEIRRRGSDDGGAAGAVPKRR